MSIQIGNKVNLKDGFTLHIELDNIEKYPHVQVCINPKGVTDKNDKRVKRVEVRIDKAEYTTDTKKFTYSELQAFIEEIKRQVQFEYPNGMTAQGPLWWQMKTSWNANEDVKFKVTRTDIPPYENLSVI